MDPNPTTKEYVLALVSRIDREEDAKSELQLLFPRDRRIGFGTAGLRSKMSPGPLGMNDLIIVQTTQGLARCCQAQNEKCAVGKELVAVVGFDHRANTSLDISSRSLALLTKIVFEEAGMKCILLDCVDSFVHTPLVAFATKRLGASVGCMITASHNPKLDNGFKVYWNDGCQIRPPVDEQIANFITKQENLTPWSDYGSILSKKRKENEGSTDLCIGLSDPIETTRLANEYFESIKSSGLVTGQSALLGEEGWNPPVVAHTAMHGIGNPWAVRCYATFDLRPFLSVPIQEKPDPAFTTVSFPNPEEKGALDHAMKFAEENGCDLVFANDPDADRLAVAEKCRESGTWNVFTGDQIGTILGHWLWSNMSKKTDKPVAMCASTVSSSMLSAIAKTEGFHFEETLTGFKWIGSVLNRLRSEGYYAILGYEEAIGFACGEVVSDKDGITALGVMTELAYSVYRRELNLSKHMQCLYDKYGEFVSNNGYFICHNPAIAHKIFDKIRKGNGGSYIKKVGEYMVESIRDLGVPGYDSTTRDKNPQLPTSASSPMMTIRFANGCVAQFRASGTEPKFKYYIEMQGQPGVSREEVTKELMRASSIILETLLEPDSNGLAKY